MGKSSMHNLSCIHRLFVCQSAPMLWLCETGPSKVGCLQVDIYTPFSALLQHLWTLWEVLLLAEPLLVLAPSPGDTSAAMNLHDVFHMPVRTELHDSTRSRGFICMHSACLL